MKKIYLLIFPFLLFIITIGSVSAHVQLDNPVGGETFVTGETVIIEWSTLISHVQENWDLYFSSNGGNDWEEIKFDLGTSQLFYEWIVPPILTENARIKIVQDNTGSDYENLSGDFIITDTQTSVEIQEKNPSAFKLNPNYPNPFNPSTIINFELPTTMIIDLSIYNLLGQEVETLVSGRQGAGYHSVEWNASNLSAGAYFIKLQADEFIQIKKAILLK